MSHRLYLDWRGSIGTGDWIHTREEAKAKNGRGIGHGRSPRYHMRRDRAQTRSPYRGTAAEESVISRGKDLMERGDL